MLARPLVKTWAIVIGVGVVSTMLVAGSLRAGEAETGKAVKAPKDDYPLETCIVTGAKLGSMGEPVEYHYKGREIRFCCRGCVGTFEKDPETYLKKMDEAIVARELSGYPLDTCVVSGDTLGTNGAPLERVYANHLVRLCSAGCAAKFEKQSDKYLDTLDKARQEQAAEQAPKPYPLDTCLVSGAKLGSMGDPVVYTYQGQELRFCCGGCLKQFESDPEKYLKKLHTLENDGDAE
jgi:YHS domain-containing protein